MRNKVLIILSSTVLLLSSCSLAPKLSTPKMDMPSKYDNKTAQSINVNWWKNFNDPILNGLIDKALKNNDDLRIAAARIKQAQAQLGITEANLYPNISSSAGRVRQQSSKETSPYHIRTTSSMYTLSGIVSYELDLWGKLRNEKKAALHQLLSSKATQETIKLSLISNVANTYFNLISIDRQLKIAENTEKNYKNTYEYRKKQYKYGTINKIVVSQTKAQYENAKLLVETLKNQKAVMISSLSVLIGESPKRIFENNMEFSKELPNPIKIPPALPSTILEDRPDIQAALENLKAKNALIGAAKAAYFPSISLTGILGFQSMELSDLLQRSAKFWSLDTNAAQTIFDFGRTKSNVKLTEAQKEEAIAQYRQAVRNAFKEVFDALNTLKTDTSKLKSQEELVNSLKNVLDLANKRFDTGYSDYLEVLDAQKGYLNARLNLERLKEKVLADQITLYKALGGGWKGFTNQKKIAKK